ncbi:DUF4190 domain-containing protein [Kribbella sp. NPDC054772]
MSQPPYGSDPERPQDDRPQDRPHDPTRPFPTYGRPEQPHAQQAGSQGTSWAAPGQPPPAQAPYGAGQPGGYGQQVPYGQQAGYGQPGQAQYGAGYGSGYAPGQYPPAYGQAPAPYGYGYGYQASGGTNGLATAALVTGLGGIFVGLSAPVAIGLGIAALVQIKRRGQAGKGMAIAGLVIGSLVTLGYALLFGLVIAYGSSSDDDYGSPEPVSSYSTGPTTEVDSLAVGECFDDTGQDSEVIRQPCTEPHDGEIISDVRLAAGAWPGDNAVDKAAEQACSPTFTSYVGKSTADSELELMYWTPTKRLWNQGDRLTVCAAYGPDGDQLTSSVKNSHR